MSKKHPWNKPGIISVLVIISVAAFLRFYNYASLSITADGVSAIERTLVSSFSELIEKGIKPDFHPALVQILLFYWSKVFGITTASIRIPFIIAGILSVLLSYLIASKWFGKFTGLMVASAVCFLEFPLTYAQIERPYSTGLFLSLLTVWFWSSYLHPSLDLPKGERKKLLLLVGYTISTSLCMLNHYFSFLFAFIVGITGFFFLNKENWKGYVIAGICSVALCLPHLEVYIHQLSKGGIGGAEGWLAPPEADFLWKFLFYSLNNSYWLSGLFASIFIVSIIFFLRTFQFKASSPCPTAKAIGDTQLGRPGGVFRIICLVWFFIPFLIGYYYSKHVNPILQYSVLLFSFPFLIMFLFSFIRDQNLTIKNLSIAGLFLTAGTYNTIFEKQFYSTNHFGVLKELALKSIEWTDKLGDKNIAKAITLDSPYFINYYFDQYNNHPSFFSYKVEGKEKLFGFIQSLDTCKTPYFMYAWSTRHSPVELPEIIKEKYPYTVERLFYYNSEFYLFAKNQPERHSGPDRSAITDKVLYQQKNDFEKDYKNFMDNEKSIIDSMAFSGTKCVLLNDSNNFSPVFKCKLKELFHSPSDIINVNIMALLADEEADAEIVITLESGGKSYFWVSNALTYCIHKKNEWQKAFFSIRIPRIKNLNDEIKIYVWNHSGKNVYIDNLEVKITEGNPVVYGERENYN